jgi:hypothetical protein
LQVAINTWLAAHPIPPSIPPPAPTQTTFICEVPLHAALSFQTCSTPATRIEEVAESHMLQVTRMTDSKSDSNSGNKSPNIYKVFMAEKKRHAGRPSKLPEAKPAKLITPSVPQVELPKSSAQIQPSIPST